MIVIFILTQLLAYLIWPLFKCEIWGFKFLYEKLYYADPYIGLWVTFLLETYIDLLNGSLINTENSFLIDKSKMWGLDSLMTVSDQFSIVFGYFVLISCLLFPYISFVLLDRKKELRY